MAKYVKLDIEKLYEKHKDKVKMFNGEKIDWNNIKEFFVDGQELFN